jgi:hypothetical protein
MNAKAQGIVVFHKGWFKCMLNLTVSLYQA